MQPPPYVPPGERQRRQQAGEIARQEREQQERTAAAGRITGLITKLRQAGYPHSIHVEKQAKLSKRQARHWPKERLTETPRGQFGVTAVIRGWFVNGGVTVIDPRRESNPHSADVVVTEESMVANTRMFQDKEYIFTFVEDQLFPLDQPERGELLFEWNLGIIEAALQRILESS